MVEPVALPNFLVIGAAKAGTTSLYHYLAQHPQIFMSPVKEPRFFALAGHALDFRGPNDQHIRRTTTTTLEAYGRLFAGVRGERAVGEASTIYLDSEVSPDAIHRHIPDVRLIAVLRDPAERAYSAFLYLSNLGSEPESDFERALDDEPRRRAAHWFHYWRYRERGFYHLHLSRYFARFEARRIRVYLYEDLDLRPQAVLSDLFAFLGVDASFRPDVSRRHHVSGGQSGARWRRLLRGAPAVQGALKRLLPDAALRRLERSFPMPRGPRPPLDPRVRAKLVDGYREDIGRLEALIQRDLSAWLR